MLNLIPHIHIPIYDSFLCSVVFLNIVTAIFIMAESSARTGLTVVCTSGGSDANVARFSGKELEAYFIAGLTGRSRDRRLPSNSTGVTVFIYKDTTYSVTESV